MPRLALVGKHISHSLSKSIYEKLLGVDVDYFLLDFESESNIPQLEGLFEQYDLDGLSVTSPYKLYFRDQVDLLIDNKRPINCIKRVGDKFYSENTDYLAMQKLLPALLNSYSLSQVVLLGDGAMGKVTLQITQELGVDVDQFCRRKNGDISDLDLSRYSDSLIINACSRDFCYKGKLAQGRSIFWNLNYNHSIQSSVLPHEKYIDGINLLHEQAQFALSFWDIESSD